MDRIRLLDSIENGERIADISHTGSYLQFKSPYNSHASNFHSFGSQVEVAQAAHLDDQRPILSRVKQQMEGLPLIGNTLMVETENGYFFLDNLPLSPIPSDKKIGYMEGVFEDKPLVPVPIIRDRDKSFERTINELLHLQRNRVLVGHRYVDCTPQELGVSVSKELLGSADIEVPGYKGRVRENEDGSIRYVAKYGLETEFFSKDQIMESPILRGILGNESSLETLAGMLSVPRSGKISLKANKEAPSKTRVYTPSIFGRDLTGLTLDLTHEIRGPAFSVRTLK